MTTSVISDLMKFFEMAKNAPPFPVVVNALSKLLGEAIAFQAKKRGPSAAFMLRIELEGMNAERARAWYEWVITDALSPRDEDRNFAVPSLTIE